MSATRELEEVAASFAGGGGGDKMGVVFEMETGMIDRGADISIMSQYPHEEEVLFAPLTGLERASKGSSARATCCVAKLNKQKKTCA